MIKSIYDFREIKPNLNFDTKYSQVRGLVSDNQKINFDDYPELKIISVVGVETDNIDMLECNKRKIKVTTTPCFELINSVAELTVLKILQMLRVNKETINGKTIGIIGYGRIGKRVAYLLGRFNRGDCYIYDTFYYPDSRYDLIEKSDIICVHISGKQEVLGQKEIDKMKMGSYVVNMAQSGNVNIEAIVNALISGRIMGYATDVENISIASLAVQNKIFVTNHTGLDIKLVKKRMEQVAIENIKMELDK